MAEPDQKTPAPKKAPAAKKAAKKPAPAGGFQTHQVQLTVTRGALPAIEEACTREIERLREALERVPRAEKERAKIRIAALTELKLQLIHHY